MVFRLSQRKGEARRPPTTGKRKGKAAATDENVHAAPSQPRPRPKPIRKPAPQQVPGGVENNAALALLAIQTGEPEPLQDRPQVTRAQPADRVFARVFNIPVDEVIADFEAYNGAIGDEAGEAEEEDGAEEDGAEELEEEKDELDDDDCDEELPVFCIPMEVPYGKKGTRNLAGITSKTSFDTLLEKVDRTSSHLQRQSAQE
ncbi:hypothetical protein CCMSSC00406_0002585 [Pleurotus cornucopiae]|uniref:Uncharacterized protein n=1 Tax=Pleurotus cornucopiae TaxID=5321 RepID=A0ACB7ISX0_PLECO|nr:hypothetical protein CCMSSC00406_0002585 [Pleurotus cornucopiae]